MNALQLRQGMSTCLEALFCPVGIHMLVLDVAGFIFNGVESSLVALLLAEMLFSTWGWMHLLLNTLLDRILLILDNPPSFPLVRTINFVILQADTCQYTPLASCAYAQ